MLAMDFGVYALVLLVRRLPVEPLNQLEEAAGDCLPVHVVDMFLPLVPFVFSDERFDFLVGITYQEI